MDEKKPSHAHRWILLALILLNDLAVWLIARDH